MYTQIRRVFVCMSFVLVPLGFATVVLDQSQTAYNAGTGVYKTNICLQTFTPGISSNLDHVELRMGSAYPTIIPVTVSIVTVTIDEEPILQLLGSSTVNDLGYGGWITFDFASQNIALTKDALYGLYVEADDPDYQSPNVSWYFQNNTNPYEAGGLWLLQNPGGWRLFNLTADNADACFKTYMVPEPATVLLLTLGGLVLRTWRG
jgi:hypothetical protein